MLSRVMNSLTPFPLTQQWQTGSVTNAKRQYSADAFFIVFLEIILLNVTILMHYVSTFVYQILLYHYTIGACIHMKR